MLLKPGPFVHCCVYILSEPLGARHLSRKCPIYKESRGSEIKIGTNCLSDLCRNPTDLGTPKLGRVGNVGAQGNPPTGFWANCLRSIILSNSMTTEGGWEFIVEHSACFTSTNSEDRHHCDCYREVKQLPKKPRQG